MTRLRTVEPVIVFVGAMALFVLGTSVVLGRLAIRVERVGEQRWRIKPDYGAYPAFSGLVAIVAVVRGVHRLSKHGFAVARLLTPGPLKPTNFAAGVTTSGVVTLRSSRVAVCVQ